MAKRKVFVFLPDGVGLRNFAYTNFNDLGQEMGMDVIYWNNSIFPLQEELGLKEVKIGLNNLNPMTPIYSRARKRIELNLWQKEFNDPVYETYKFPLKYNGLKKTTRSVMTSFLIATNNSENGLKAIKRRISKLEYKNPKYQYCKNQLEKYKPDLVLCTTQRATQAISALLAAKDLGIPTATFIYSWDNVPKAMLVVETDYYFVWSGLMKSEMLKYYPFLKENQIIVTGTPQFEPHFNPDLVIPKAKFFADYGLDEAKEYICFSGDDTTTSPLDQYYLEDLALAVRQLNKQDHNLGIIFRKAPVDHTGRYQKIVEKYKEEITQIDPAWKAMGEQWNTILPEPFDFSLLATVCEHSELVANVCSSMVFDFAIHNKPCIYFNYEQPQLQKGIRDIGQNYKYVHFRSMPSENAVAWATSKEGLQDTLENLLKDPKPIVAQAQNWFTVIVGKHPKVASKNIWNTIKNILN
ncbi:UDP-glycosyltransferase [Zunongwangia endophytica]|uniref:UDP-glycosyltransferase n=1 Tax=Zunongwangia endophytica TaxID=1808945 RepID=A0ABV8H953_9FLAO|nr:UDP-glycosyltransferase [Zunongwangia endophytica]MDN3595029.1 UDP-glycosyltransferase [Zunongwangia endophytica]